MIGVIRRPNWKKSFDPDSVFDPTTHIATESNFIKLLENGIYDTKYIGYGVALNNSAAYNGGIWVIGDVSHDSVNTGQSDCYDLISNDGFSPQTFSDSSDIYTGRDYRQSNVRRYLNNTLYGGFSSALKAHMLNPKYNSQGTWYDDDKIIEISYREVNGNNSDSSSYWQSEGTPYSIFTNTTSRIKKQFNTNTNIVWWTRSRNTIYSGMTVWIVNELGQLYLTNNSTAYGDPQIHCVVPILRVA